VKVFKALEGGVIVGVHRNAANYSEYINYFLNSLLGSRARPSGKPESTVARE